MTEADLSTVEAIGDAVCLLDAQGAVRRGNLVFAELFAQSRQERLGDIHAEKRRAARQRHAEPPAQVGGVRRGGDGRSRV